ncbi:MAG: STAS domain-containing protein [Candidatus Omnitrophica bacterium]|nr:STAS domain-containing protein [Candidatus Omnitrophota bacterium]
MDVSMETKNDIMACRINGVIDINTSPELKKKFEKVVKEKVPKVLINLERVEYVDSSGLATMVEILKKMRAYGGKLKLSNLSGKVKGLFEITKLDKLFDISDSESQALGSF